MRKAGNVQGAFEAPRAVEAQPPEQAPPARRPDDLVEPSPVPDLGLERPRPNPAADPAATARTNLVEAKRLAFSRPALELSTLLQEEIRRACEFVNSVRVAFTFLGGARIPSDHPLFALGKEWGEALFLANLTAEDPVLGVRAIASGLYSPHAIAAARAVVLGAAAGLGGASELGRALAAVGGASSPEAISAAIARVEHARIAPTDVKLLLGLQPRPRTGGGPGMMDAVPVGYVAARQKLLQLVPNVPRQLLSRLEAEGARMGGNLPFEQKESKAIEEMGYFFHFISRRLALMAGAVGIVVFPGGLGTLNELFEAVRDGAPIVFDGSEFWKDIVDTVKAKWSERDLVPRDAVDFGIVVDGTEKGLPYLLSHGNLARSVLPSVLVEQGRRMGDDLERGLATLAYAPTAVTFVGGRRLRRDDEEIGVAADLATMLSEDGVPCRVGGDRAIFDAVVEGRERSARSAGLALQALIDDHGDLDLEKIRSKASICEIVQSAVVHKLLMYENTDAIVALPGGKGTFDEVFEVACLMMTKNLPPRPLILIGRRFWAPIIAKCKAAMDNDEHRTVAAGDFEKYFQIVDTAEEARALIRAHRNHA